MAKGDMDQARQLEVLEEIRETVNGLKEDVAALKARMGDLSVPEVSAPVRGQGRRCQRGHGMQLSDDYCQHCDREDNPRAVKDRYKAPRANRMEITPLVSEPRPRPDREAVAVDDSGDGPKSAA
jgi:hypothetical protein